MANELTVSASLAYNPSVANHQKIPRFELIKRVSMTGADFSMGTQALTTSEEALDITSDIGTTGMVFIKNLDASNTVLVGLTGSFPVRCLAGEYAQFRANGTIFVKTSSSTAIIQYWVFEE